MLLNSFKAVGGFFLGGSITLLFEKAVEEMQMGILTSAMVLGVVLLILGYWTEVRDWLWMKKQKPMEFDLTVVALTGVYSFLAKLEQSERTLFSVTWDIKNKNKFAVRPGEKL